VALPTAPSSYWLDRDALEPRPPLAADAVADLAIVGAGIASAFAALAAARAGLRVLVLEADAAGRGATGRNAGFLLAEGAESSAEVARSASPAVAHALRAAGLATRDLVASLGRSADLDLSFPGSLRLAGSPEEAADLRATRALVGLPLEVVPAADLEARYGDRGYLSGLLDPGDGQVNPLRLLAAAFAEAEAAGVARRDASPVTAIEETARGVLVRTPRATVTASRVLVAVNAWITRCLGGAPWVRPVRAQMLAARATPAPAWMRPVYADRGADYWRRLPDGTLLLGGRRLVGDATEETDDASPAAPVQPALDALLRRLVGDARVEVVARWAGTMGFTADAVPAAGRAPGRERTWVLGGFNGHGMGWGPGLATALVGAMTGRGPALPACYDPAREALARRVVPAPAARG
jgi:gamma-glutamylputrescine oxidase